MKQLEEGIETAGGRPDADDGEGPSALRFAVCVSRTRRGCRFLSGSARLRARVADLHPPSAGSIVQAPDWTFDAMASASVPIASPIAGSRMTARVPFPSADSKSIVP